jgi:hypothetical protein
VERREKWPAASAFLVVCLEDISGSLVVVEFLVDFLAIFEGVKGCLVILVGLHLVGIAFGFVCGCGKDIY